ncbi:hypothetical protein BCV70DRAFT_103143 [Testicularia cyperi]|uniref:Uncharacterized protein n=1 Tax=Testicularia cyperi TaxID=1882483 RepID=A0A317XRI1_9BASI|nr:hypothetical protein BCV70DRAFT_103143 [Testicularia cyperi]
MADVSTNPKSHSHSRRVRVDIYSFHTQDEPATCTIAPALLVVLHWLWLQLCLSAVCRCLIPYIGLFTVCIFLVFFSLFSTVLYCNLERGLF